MNLYDEVLKALEELENKALHSLANADPENLVKLQGKYLGVAHVRKNIKETMDKYYKDTGDQF